VSAPLEIAVAGRIGSPPEPGAAGFLDRLLPGSGPWEVEIGFGKGRFLLARAAARPGRRFLGIEVAGEYFRLAARRARSRGLGNVALLHGEALYLLAAVLPRGFADELHVYFPDPWPKSRHQRRRLFSPASVDLVLGALAPGGRLWFATDFLDYGAEVEEILRSHPALAVERIDPGWPEGPRTNYEAKYVTEGRPILRLGATLVRSPEPHPRGEAELLAAVAAGAAGEDGN
jgi:tRNA (guanine-N7-)-methyltransferase